MKPSVQAFRTQPDDRPTDDRGRNVNTKSVIPSINSRDEVMTSPMK